MTAPITAPEPVTCPACGNILGELLTVKGLPLLHASGGVWRVLRGYCVQCGKPFYWETSDNQLKDVIQLSKDDHG